MTRKITRKQLRQIIKEEITLMSETMSDEQLDKSLVVLNKIRGFLSNTIAELAIYLEHHTDAMSNSYIMRKLRELLPDKLAEMIYTGDESYKDTLLSARRLAAFMRALGDDDLRQQIVAVIDHATVEDPTGYGAPENYQQVIDDIVVLIEDYVDRETSSGQYVRSDERLRSIMQALGLD